MKPFLNSIKRRLGLASIILLPIVCALLGWSLDRAYVSSLLENQHRQLLLHTYALMASAELEEGQLWLPPHMTDDRFNQVSSDLSALVYSPELRHAIWTSASATGNSIAEYWLPAELPTGQSRFNSFEHQNQNYFFLQYSVAWEDDYGTALPFQFVVFQHEGAYLDQISAYRNTLWFWLVAITLVIISLQVVILSWGLRPLNKITKDLQSVQKGQSAKLDHAYPEELSGLANAINKLIEHERNQRERYRNTLSDLAHSIKNPLAIISSAISKLKKKDAGEATLDIAEQSERINQIISYQLTRAVGQSSAPFHKAISAAEVFNELKSALDKVYADKAMHIQTAIDSQATFRGDQGDLMELLGNLLDNAYKYGDSKIRVELKDHTEKLRCTVEDDGAGISDEEQNNLLRRGKRLDSSLPGQGIGLAVVEDIIQSYDGELTMSRSELGGLKIAFII